MQTDTITESHILNKTVKQCISKAIDMLFYWVSNSCKQEHFLIYWAPGKYNMGDYHTKFHSPLHHNKQRPLHVNTKTSPQYITGDTSSLQQGRIQQFTTLNRTNMFQGKIYNNQDRPNISHGKLLATCVAILGEQPNTIRSMN